MYGFIFRHLPGPKWLKVIESLVLILAVVFVLFEWVFPLVNTYIVGNTCLLYTSDAADEL